MCTDVSPENLDRVRSWRDRPVLVTGGAGFLGSHLITRMRAAGYRQIVVPRSRDYDLTREAAVERLYMETHPTLVIHLAARVGGIGANQAQPGRFFYDNLIMGALVMEYARRYRVEKFVAVGTICSYPKHTPIPFRETDLWNGYPEETNAPYGLAMKMLLVQAQAFRAQYNFPAIFLLPVNLYGPGDSTDPERSHVIPALIRKCLEARAAEAESITVWGDGSPTREFLYVEDAAEGILLATEQYEDPAPMNLGSGVETSIRDLVHLICRLTGYAGRVVWDTSRPNGQPRRCVDTTRAAKLIGFRAATPLEEGLTRTIAWYQAALQATGAERQRT